MNISSQQSVKRPEWVPGQHGFTLVELLLVVAIIAILSTLSLAMIRTSQEEARASATQSRINQIEAILSVYLEEMEFRRLPISWEQLRSFARANTDVAPAATLEARINVNAADLRDLILADYMNVEMPRDSATLKIAPADIFPSLKFQDQVLNVYYNSAASTPSVPGTMGKSVRQFLAEDCQTASTFRWAQVKSAGGDSVDNQGELLFQLLSMIQFEGESGVESLGNGAQGDSDGDGIKEIVDAWGEPLNFEIIKRTYSDTNSNQNGLWTGFKFHNYDPPFDQTNGGIPGPNEYPVGIPSSPFYEKRPVPLFEDFQFMVFSSNPAVPRRVEFRQ